MSSGLPSPLRMSSSHSAMALPMPTIARRTSAVCRSAFSRDRTDSASEDGCLITGGRGGRGAVDEGIVEYRDVFSLAVVAGEKSE